MRQRPTARLLVVDGQARLLLLCVEDATFRYPRFWITPGGGVHPGETFEQAALRELWEETGIVAPLGPCVWTRRHIIRFVSDLIALEEQYFVVKVESAIISLANGTDWERQAVTEHRWWTAEELAATDDLVMPRCLSEVLPPILAGLYPSEPLPIGP